MAQETVITTNGIKEVMLDASLSTFGKITTLFILHADVLMMWVFLGFLIIGFITLLMAWNNDQTNDIVIADLICVDGKLNEPKMARFGAFIVSTWAFVYLVVTAGMTEWYFVGYMTAWVGNALFSRYMTEMHDKDANGNGRSIQPPLADDGEEPGTDDTEKPASRSRRRG